MEIALFPPMPTRPCRFCLRLQGGSVFADFGVDPDGRVYATRDSEALLEMVQQGSIDPAAASVLRTYFDANRGALWDDALAHHGLL